MTNFAEEKGDTKFIKNYESAKKRGNGEKDLIQEVHNVIYDNSDKVNTKIKEVQKPIKYIGNDQQSDQQSESETSDDENSEGSEPTHNPEPDEYVEFQKLMNESSEESEPESEPE